ncbi:MAG: hypothetical protein ACTSWN_03340 [Promethearchaeota archaeon]
MVVRNYRICGYYKGRNSVYKNYFEKEVREITVDAAIEKVKRLISSKNVHPRRIVITRAYEVVDPKFLKDRVVRTFAEENLKLEPASEKRIE